MIRNFHFIQVYTEAQEWFESIASNVRERILSHFGPFPSKDDNFKVRFYLPYIITMYVKFAGIQFT